MAVNVRNLEARIEALERQASPKVSLAKRLYEARKRWHGMSEAERSAIRAERLARPEPRPAGTMRHRLWLAERRVAAKLAEMADTRLR